MSSFFKGIFTVIFGTILFFAALPLILIAGMFSSANEMGEYMVADFVIDREKERGVTFVSTDKDYTLLN